MAGTVTTAEKEPVAFVVIVGTVRVIVTAPVNFTVTALVAPKPWPVRVRESPGNAFASYVVSEVEGVVLETRLEVTAKGAPTAPLPSLTTMKWFVVPKVADGIVTVITYVPVLLAAAVPNTAPDRLSQYAVTVLNGAAFPSVAVPITDTLVPTGPEVRATDGRPTVTGT